MLMAKQIKLRRDQQKERKVQQEQGVQMEYELARQQRNAVNEGQSMFLAAFSQQAGMPANAVLTTAPVPTAMNFIGLQSKQLEYQMLSAPQCLLKNVYNGHMFRAEHAVHACTDRSAAEPRRFDGEECICRAATSVGSTGNQ